MAPGGVSGRAGQGLQLQSDLVSSRNQSADREASRQQLQTQLGRLKDEKLNDNRRHTHTYTYTYTHTYTYTEKLNDNRRHTHTYTYTYTHTYTYTEKLNDNRRHATQIKDLEARMESVNEHR
jgi:hypothetical protein